jgi:hypothetical protein
LHDHGLEVHLQTRSIRASKCLSKPIQLQTQSTSSRSNCGCMVTLVQQRWIEWWGVYIRQTPKSIDILSVPSQISIQWTYTPYISFHSLCLRLCGCMQLSGFSMLGSIISCNQIPMLLETEHVLLMRSIWMSQGVRQSVNGGLSTF